MALVELGPTPADIGLPFPSWRDGQWSLITSILDSDASSHLLVAPTGFGKSSTYMGMAVLSGGRTVILTATKALQDQLVRDFSASGLFDVRGQGAYPCTLTKYLPQNAHMVKPGATAATAPCRWGFECPLKVSAGCPYYDRVRQARNESLVVTNYDFWLHNQHNLGDINLLIMDEAHQAPQELADHLSFRLTSEMRKHFASKLPDNDSIPAWQYWARMASASIKGKLESHKGHPPQALQDLYQGISTVDQKLSMGEWVIERFDDGAVAFDCVNPESFGSLLWGAVDRVVLVSATANKMTAHAIGITEVEEWAARSSFPKERRPVWAVEGAVQVNFRMVEGQKRQWVNLIDRIMDSRLDRKGIIHTTSFERARYLQQYSRHAKRLVLNESRTTRSVVENFKLSKGNSVLVSPSVTTGYDFPYSECEFQIVAKIPFPDLRTKAAQEKVERNREWAGYMAAQVIVQSSGRGMRAEDDQCETFIVDGNFGWWWRGNRKFTPKWWQDAVRFTSIGGLPPAPERLGD